MNHLDSEGTVGSTEKRPKQHYDESHFSVYRDDPKRLVMYETERERIERLKSSGRILDVGCGLGLFLLGFSPEKWDRYGVDISETAINESRSRGIQVGDFADAYHYSDAFFDVIVFRGSLPLIPTPLMIVEICIRLLVPGGYMVFLSTPNSNSPLDVHASKSTNRSLLVFQMLIVGALSEHKSGK